MKRTFYTEAAYAIGIAALALGTALMEKADYAEKVEAALKKLRKTANSRRRRAIEVLIVLKTEVTPINVTNVINPYSKS